MALFLVLFWSSAVIWRSIAANSRNSRFDGFNSRLGLLKFPVRAATGISLQTFDFAILFRVVITANSGKSTKFPLEREKLGNRAAILSAAAR